jgi:LemA protein
MNLKVWQIGCLGLIAAVVIPTLMFGCSVVNETVTLKQANNACDESMANVLSVYQRRHDLIPNLVNTVKGSANFEHDTLKDVIEARRQVTNLNVNASDPKSLEKFVNAQGALTVATTNLANFVREKYPTLASTALFVGLMAQLEGTENRANVERQNYNGKVKALNDELVTITGGIANKWANVAPRKMWEVSSAAQEAPSVDFEKKK